MAGDAFFTEVNISIVGGQKQGFESRQILGGGRQKSLPPVTANLRVAKKNRLTSSYDASARRGPKMFDFGPGDVVRDGWVRAASRGALVVR